MSIKKSESFSEFITCYHFCTKQWLKDLETEKVIKPIFTSTDGYCRIGAYNKLMSHLNFSSLVFYWENLEDIQQYKNNFTLGTGDYFLLTLQIPRRLCVTMNYYNWCDFLFSFVYAKTEEEVLKAMHQEFGNDATLEQLLGDSFKVSSEDLIQIVTEYCKFDWVTKIEQVDKLVI